MSLSAYYSLRPRNGAIAQLGERLHGMQEVDGSIPSSSTTSQLNEKWHNMNVLCLRRFCPLRLVA